MVNPNLKQLYALYKRNAKKRGIEFDFPFEWFAELTQQDCYICGAKPSSVYVHDYKQKCYTTQPYIYNGVDRCDNTLGYHAANLAACCGRCNVAKSNLTFDELMEWVQCVYLYNFT